MYGRREPNLDVSYASLNSFKTLFCLEVSASSIHSSRFFVYISALFELSNRTVSICSRSASLTPVRLFSSRAAALLSSHRPLVTRPTAGGNEGRAQGELG